MQPSRQELYDCSRVNGGSVRCVSGMPISSLSVRGGSLHNTDSRRREFLCSSANTREQQPKRIGLPPANCGCVTPMIQKLPFFFLAQRFTFIFQEPGQMSQSPATERDCSRTADPDYILDVVRTLAQVSLASSVASAWLLRSELGGQRNTRTTRFWAAVRGGLQRHRLGTRHNVVNLSEDRLSCQVRLSRARCMH